MRHEDVVTERLTMGCCAYVTPPGPFEKLNVALCVPVYATGALTFNREKFHGC